MILEELQKKLKDEKLEAALITRNNMFLGEDTLPDENLIQQLTNFSGSAGNLIVTPQNAWLVVDGRYAIQVRKETDPKKITVIDSKPKSNEIIKLTHKNHITSLAFNPWCLSALHVTQLESSGLQMIARDDLPGNIISSQPVEIFEHAKQYSGKSAEEKCREASINMPNTIDAMLICDAQKVSWLTNLRSKTLPDTPVLRAYAILDCSGKTTLFAPNCCYPNIYPLEELPKYLTAYKGKNISIDILHTPQKIFDLIPDGINIQKNIDTITPLKLTKNPTELEGFKQAHLKDAIAVTQFLFWLEGNWQGKTELDVAAKLKTLREQQPLFFSDSFGTIAAAAANAAIVHYQPSKKSNSILKSDSVLLLDSGAQYLDGTTDVTRTIALGKPDKKIIDDFTIVLKAHIALSSLQFPDKTPGYMLDAVSRSILWKYGKDYNHGTGHSVGHFANVHESPFGLSVQNGYPISVSYVTSIEPGYYKEDEYGIRIENMVYTTPSDTPGFLKFENLTLIPIDKRLINKYLLSSEEQAWLNSYHQKVFGCLAPYLDTDIKAWLKEACSPL